MNIGKVIRDNRKLKGLTQEEMANLLGVTAPAVNKWEKGSSYPDITLLAPIARLLDISIDTLLSFEEELSQAELNMIIMKLTDMCAKNYDEAFQYAKDNISKYPNAEFLLYQAAILLEVHKMQQGIENEEYDKAILSWYQNTLKTQNEDLKLNVASSLFNYYVKKQDYDKAEEYIQYYSSQNPERKRKLAKLEELRGNKEEALKIYEEMLFTEYTLLSVILNDIYTLEQENKEKANSLLIKQIEIAKVFERGIYCETTWQLQQAALNKDEVATLQLVKQLIDSTDNLYDFAESPLYEHITFTQVSKEENEQVRQMLIKSIVEDKEQIFDYMSDNKEWNELFKC